MIVTVAPCPARMIPKRIVDVDFPAPPLELAKTMHGMVTAIL